MPRESYSIRSSGTMNSQDVSLKILKFFLWIKTQISNDHVSCDSNANHRKKFIRKNLYSCNTETLNQCQLVVTDHVNN